MAKKLKDFSEIKVVVIGDLMLDVFTVGTVSRISPEAPVPVFEPRHPTDYRLGGAGNVARNLCALGAQTHLVGAVSDDNTGQTVVHLVDEILADRALICRAPNTVTTCKHRFIADGFQQLLRVDHESPPLWVSLKASLDYVQKVKPDVVILSDYDKGAIRPALSTSIMSLSPDLGFSVVVDSKSRDWHQFAGADLVTPNLGEVANHMGDAVIVSHDALRQAAKNMLGEVYAFKSAAITCGADGIWLQVNTNIGVPIPGHTVQVNDVTGAGDVVTAAMAVAKAAGHDLLGAAEFANYLASRMVQQPMTALPTTDDIEQARIQTWTNRQKANGSQPESSPDTTEVAKSSDS